MCLGEDKSLEGTETHFLFSTWLVEKRVEKLQMQEKKYINSIQNF